MLYWIIQMSIISFILITLVHYLFTFFMTNLTIPKVKDLVNKPQHQYEVLYNTIRQPPKIPDIIPEINSQTTDNDNMKTELKNYLKELSDKKTYISDSSNTVNGITHVNDIGNAIPMDGGFSSCNYSSF